MMADPVFYAVDMADFGYASPHWDWSKVSFSPVRMNLELNEFLNQESRILTKNQTKHMWIYE